MPAEESDELNGSEPISYVAAVQVSAGVNGASWGRTWRCRRPSLMAWASFSL